MTKRVMIVMISAISYKYIVNDDKNVGNDNDDDENDDDDKSRF